MTNEQESLLDEILVKTQVNASKNVCEMFDYTSVSFGVLRCAKEIAKARFDFVIAIGVYRLKGPK